VRRSYPRALPAAMATRKLRRPCPWIFQPKEEKLRLCEKGRSFFQICPDLFLGKKRENTHELYQRGKGMLLPQAEPFYSRGAVGRRDSVCHVKNTGRCRELLVPGAEVYLQREDNPKRKTKYSLIHVQKGERLINIDSQAPNRIAGEWLPQSGLFPEDTVFLPEKAFENSRFDFYFEHGTAKGYLEVKGVTLEENGVVSFPDAPTKRGEKHLRELIRCREQGLEAYVLFVVQMSRVRYFTPNKKNDPAFAQALREAYESGVTVLAMDCLVEPEKVAIHRPVEIRF
jgi:sugar fermentation stimulation protein A